MILGRQSRGKGSFVLTHSGRDEYKVMYELGWRCWCNNRPCKPPWTQTNNSNKGSSFYAVRDFREMEANCSLLLFRYHLYLFSLLVPLFCSSFAWNTFRIEFLVPLFSYWFAWYRIDFACFFLAGCMMECLPSSLTITTSRRWNVAVVFSQWAH